MNTTFQNWMFPLRAGLMEDGTWGVWTALDGRLGSRNNFAIAVGIQHEADAIAMCDVLNDNREMLADEGTPYERTDDPERAARLRADEAYRRGRAYP